jgi:cytochrome c biogenesis protein CcmG/thiol:disulfide interchange protein DsbE
MGDLALRRIMNILGNRTRLSSTVSTLLMALWVALSITSCSGGSPNFVPGERAPEFSLRDTEGNQVRLSDFRGKVVLINFWASWCSPCLAELPALQRLQAQLKAKDFVVLGIGVDDTEEALAQYKKVYGLTYPTVIDTTSEVKRRYKVSGVPESFFVDRQGGFIMIADPETNEPVVRLVGPREWDEPKMLSRISAVLR